MFLFATLLVHKFLVVNLKKHNEVFIFYQPTTAQQEG